jgi:hypothetical protein
MAHLPLYLFDQQIAGNIASARRTLKKVCPETSDPLERSPGPSANRRCKMTVLSFAILARSVSAE